MRFSDNGYYIEKYIKCDNCGVLIYDEGGQQGEIKGEPKLFCSDWCEKWATARADGIEEPRIPLPKQGIHETG
jgi:5-oxoprolinase (ATP-hydrolysing)/N-methylhydantoinase B